MFSKNGRRRGKAGRPSYDKLGLYFHVIDGTRRERLSVNKFCARFPLAVISRTADGPRVVQLKGATLRRRFVEARSALIHENLDVLNDALESWVEDCRKNAS